MVVRILRGDCIELNPTYGDMATDRVAADAPLFAQIERS